MPIHTLPRLVARVVGKLPLRTVLIIPFALQIVGTVGLVGYFSYRDAHEDAHELVTQLQLEVNSRIVHHLDSYLATPAQLNKINVEAYELGLLNFSDFKRSGQYFWQQLQIFKINYINFATPKGEFIGAGDYGQGSIQIEEIPKNTKGKSYTYDTDKKGNRTRLVSVQDFNPHAESWYLKAARAGKPIWSDIYNWDTNPEILSIAASYPLYDEKKTLIGVTGIDLKLSEISRFLKTLKIGKSGRVFIVERSGLLVASSVNQPSFTIVNGKAQRLNILNSRIPAFQQTTQYLQQHFGNLGKTPTNPQPHPNISDEHQSIQVFPWGDKLGLDWLIVVVIPKSDFEESFETDIRFATVVVIGTLILALVNGIFAARWVTKPILNLNSAAKNIAKGDWNKRLDIERNDEIGELTKSFNQMATQLQESFTELQSLNQALSQSESQLRQFFDALPIGVSIHEATGKVLYFNQTAKHLLGIEHIPDASNEELAQVYQIYRQNQLYPTEELPAVRALKGEAVFVDDIQVYRDGKMIPYEIRSTPIFDEQGNIIYAINAFANITQRKQAEQLLANYNHTLEAEVADRTAKLAQANELLKLEIAERKLLEGKLSSSTQQVRTIFESISDIVLIIDEKKNIQIIPTKGIDWYADGTNLINSIAELFFQEDAEKNWFPKVRQALETQETVNFDYSLRINHQEVWWAARISPLPDNSVVWVARDISDRKQVEDALRRYERIISATADAIFVVDCNYIYQVVNQTYLTWHNKQYDEIVGHSLRDFLGEDIFNNPIKQYLDRCLSGEVLHWQLWFEYATQGRRFLSVTYSPYLEADNRISGVVASLRDLTELKQAEEALQVKTEELDRFFCASLDLLCIANIEGYFLRLNPQWEKTLGYRLEELEGTQFLDYVHPEDMESTLEAIAHLANQQEIPSFVNRYRCRDGSYRWIEWRSVPVGNMIYAGARDISDRLLAEEALRQSEATNRAILSAIPDLLIWMNQDGTYLEVAVGKEFKLFNSEQSKVGANMYSILPDAIAQQRMEYAQLALQTGELQVYEHQLFVGGETRYEETRIAASEDGKVLVIVRDITERKRTEAALRESEEQLQLALEGSGDGFWDWNIQTGELYLSPRYLEMLGYDADEFRQEFSTWDRLIHPDDKPWVMETLNAHLADSSVPYTFDYQLLTKSGEYKWIANYGKVVARDENGAPLRMTGTHRDVSDKKQAEAILKQSEERYLAILEDQTELITRFQPDGTLTFVNQAFCRYYGVLRSQVLNQRYQPFIFPEDLEKIRRFLDSLNVENPVGTIEHRIVLAGEIRWMQWINRAIFDQHGNFVEFQSVGRDITEKTQAEEALKNSERKFKGAFDTIAVGMCLISIAGGFLEVNSALCQMLGYSESELLSMRWQDIVYSEDQSKELEYVERMYAGEQVGYRLEQRFLRQDGRVIWGLSSISLMRNTEQNPLYLIAQVTDITERKHSEKVLQEAKEAAEAANQAKSAFLASMSHELRTPLNGILGYAQILQTDKNCTPKQKKGVGIIHQCGTHLLTLINDILDLSKIESGKLELYPENFSLPSLLTSLSEIFQIKAIQKSITFTYRPLNPLPNVIHADEKRLRQVLMNLLSNAVKFTDRGRVTFTVGRIAHGSWLIANSQEPLAMNNEQLAMSKLRFQVEDTGIGIPSEELEKIFLPFEQVGDISHRAEGTGLGLAITQKIVELMRGQIFVESTLGMGSNFWFDLEVPEISTPMESTFVQSTENIIGYSGEQRKILIVDDRWENRTVLLNMLEPIGFEVEQAADGQEGLTNAVESQPDLIFVDLVMPVMDGYQMTRQLRQLPEFQNTIIIAISANAFTVDRQQSLEAGCNDFLPKPVQSDELFDKIKFYLNLSWMYESEARSANLGDASSSDSQAVLTEMVIPPKAVLLALYEAAITGYVQGVEQELIQLQQLNPDYTPFVSRILELADDFEYEEIINLIAPYLSQD